MISVDVLVKNRPIRRYVDRAGNSFVEGRRGSAYKLHIRNGGLDRIKAVVSVDGLNILTGDHVWDRGYVVEPRSSIDVPGWRIDRRTAAEFVFGDVREAYASDRENFGVIGVMAFRENVRYPPLRGGIIFVNTSYSPSSLGTGWGEEVSFETKETTHQFEVTPFERVVVYYDDAKGLARRGIIVGCDPLPQDPFPNYVGDDYGCKPPRSRGRG